MTNRETGALRHCIAPRHIALRHIALRRTASRARCTSPLLCHPERSVIADKRSHEVEGPTFLPVAQLGMLFPKLCRHRV